MPGKLLSEIEFNNIKKLLTLGMTYREIEDITGRSKATIGFVRAADSISDYNSNRRYLRANEDPNRKHVKKENQAQQQIQMPVPAVDNFQLGYHLNRIFAAIKTTNEILEKLLNKWE